MAGSPPIGATTLNISGSLFENNKAMSSQSESGKAHGGAIFTLNEGIFPGATLNISNSTFVGNAAVGGFSAYGGAVHVDYGVNLTVTGTSFTDNTATAGDYVVGGAMDVEQFVGGQLATQATIVGSTFQGNAATVPATSTYPFGSAEGEPYSSVVHYP